MARSAGLELQSVTTTPKDVIDDLRVAAPAILVQPRSDKLIVLSKGTRRYGVCVDPHGEEHRLPWRLLANWICAPREKHLNEQLEPLLASAKRLRRDRRRRLMNTLNRRFALPVGMAFEGAVNRRSPFIPARLEFVVAQRGRVGGGPWVAVHDVSLPRGALLGRSALGADPASGWLWLWGLLFATVLMLRTLLFWQQGTTALRVGLNLKRGLLRASLAQQPEALRRLGSGNLLARALESRRLRGPSCQRGALLRFWRS